MIVRDTEMNHTLFVHLAIASKARFPIGKSAIKDGLSVIPRTMKSLREACSTDDFEPTLDLCGTLNIQELAVAKIPTGCVSV